MKRLVAVGVALSSLFLLQGTAWAAHGVISDIDINDTAVLLPNGNVQVTGSFKCTDTPNALYRLGVNLTQPEPGPATDGGRGGPKNGGCANAATINFSVEVDPDAGDSFTTGPARAALRIQTGDQSTQILDDQTHVETITVVSPSA